jgi:hypothetical protein
LNELGARISSEQSNRQISDLVVHQNITHLVEQLQIQKAMIEASIGLLEVRDSSLKQNVTHLVEQLQIQKAMIEASVGLLEASDNSLQQNLTRFALQHNALLLQSESNHTLLKEELRVAEQYANQQQLLILLSQQNHTQTRALLKAVDTYIRDLGMVVLTKGNASDVDMLQTLIQNLSTNYSRLLNRVLEEEKQSEYFKVNVTDLVSSVAAVNTVVALHNMEKNNEVLDIRHSISNVTTALNIAVAVATNNHSRLLSSIALANLKREGSAIALTNSIGVLNASLKEQIIEEHNFSVTHFQNIETSIRNVEKTALNARRVLKLETSKNISALGIQVHAHKAITDAQHETTLLNHTKVRTDLLALSSKSSANHLENIQNHTTTMLKLQIHQSELDSSSALLLSINESLTNQLVATDALTTGKFSIMTAQLEHEQYTRIHATNNIQEFILGNITAVTETANQDRIDVSDQVHLILC